MQIVSRMPDPEGERWQPLRAGIQNLWEYDDQRFVFHGGRLLLRGRNESGKTKVIEVLLPFLLDADLSPQRLDPFGSTSRPMRWNLLNDNNPGVGTAVGYVWLELGRRDGDTRRTLTLGAGLKAKRAADGVESWYFVTDQRMDAELALFGPGRVPLTRGQLEEAIGAAGNVFSKASDYRRAVNARLFDLPEDQYHALIETLLQLRRPQLSKTLDPAGLSRILAVSLPPLDRGVLVPLADGFQRLDADRQARQMYAATTVAVDKFVGLYRRYAAACAKARTRELTSADSAFQSARSELKQRESDRAAAAERKAELSERVAGLQGEIETLDARIETLKASDAYLGARELDEAERQADAAAGREAAAEREVGIETERTKQLTERQAQADEAAESAAQLLLQAEEHASAAASDAGLAQPHAAVVAQMRAGDLDAAGLVLREVIDERRRHVADLEELVRQAERAEAEVAQAERRLQEAEARARAASERLKEAERRLDEAVDSYVTSVEEWLTDTDVLDCSDAERERLLRAEVDDMERLARDLSGATRDRLRAELQTAQVHLAEIERELQGIRDEHAALKAAEHRPPAPPSWRPERAADRPGAPLYMLCEFAGNDAKQQAGIEAALEAAGLLDAWVTPDGELLGPDVLDLVLHAGTPAERTLADVLVINETGGVRSDVVEAILASIELVDGSRPRTESWVSVDGRFRLGPLHGASAKESAQYVGATARERERQRRLDELAARVAQLDGEANSVRAGVDQLTEKLAGVDEAERSFPTLRVIIEAHAAVQAAALALESDEQARSDAEAGHAAALDALREATARRDAAAVRVGLVGWLGRLAELLDLTRTFDDAAREALRAARELATARQRAAERKDDLDAARERLTRLGEALSAAHSDSARATARAAALREAVGASAEQVLAEIGEGQRRREASRAARRQCERDVDEVATQLGAAQNAVAVAEERVAESDEARRAGEQAVKQLVDFGLLPLFDLGDLPPHATWSYTETLRAARRIDTATGRIDASQEAIDAAENRVSAGQQEFAHALPRELRLQAERVAGFLRYRVAWSGRLLDLLELRDALHAEVASRDRLMADEERKLFESFLSGEAHAHLGALLRKARDLVDRMNEQIAQRRTASGMQIRLVWQLTPEAPAGAREALDLMLRSGELLSDADRTALRRFLQQRLLEAKEDEAAGTFHERMLEVLDYRRWFAFTIEFKAAGASWKPLTRKTHGAGSGGQKAVVLHLPLFAAAAAFYESAARHAPRLIILDEAFAGIDRPTRGSLMGLLVEFDLDFVMTSYEEWGFYEELTALSTYHLAREPGVRGVFSEWFLWDGEQSTEMGAA